MHSVNRVHLCDIVDCSGVKLSLFTAMKWWRSNVTGGATPCGSITLSHTNRGQLRREGLYEIQASGNNSKCSDRPVWKSRLTDSWVYYSDVDAAWYIADTSCRNTALSNGTDLKWICITNFVFMLLLVDRFLKAIRFYVIYFPSHVRPWRICDIYDFFAPHINVLTYLLTYFCTIELKRKTRYGRMER